MEIIRNKLPLPFPYQKMGEKLRFLLSTLDASSVKNRTKTISYAEFPPEDFLFYDIETTGLSPRNSSLYLLGVLLFQKEEMEIIQYFSDSVSSEEELLSAFLSLCEGRKVLLSFNGCGFDNRYMESLSKSYHRAPLHLSLFQADLFRLIRRRKQFYGMESCSLKSCEAFLGIDRKDPYHGGELIAVYRDFLKDKDREKKKMLLLHNLEDVKNLPALLSFLSYEFLFQGKIRFLGEAHTDRRMQEEDTEKNPTAESILLQFLLPEEVPTALTHVLKHCTLRISGKEVSLSVPLYRGELSCFFQNYKDYVYIPAEDRAVHKSLSSLYPKAMWEKAKKETAYQKLNAVFLPVWKEERPQFQKSYQDKQYFIPYQKNIWEKRNPVDYLLSLLKTGIASAHSQKK